MKLGRSACALNKLKHVFILQPVNKTGVGGQKKKQTALADRTRWQKSIDTLSGGSSLVRIFSVGLVLCREGGRQKGCRETLSQHHSESEISVLMTLEQKHCLCLINLRAGI